MAAEDASNNTLPPHQVGDTLKEATTGHSVAFTLHDGSNVDPDDQLSCQCYAPSGKTCNVLLTDNEDGTYTIDLNAYEPGLHTVEVEWDGKPIPGSPFLVRIMQSADEQKVRAYGPGLFSGVLETFQGVFLVDTKGGGPGALKVRIHGPKECFKVEMSRDNPTDRIINVTYNPTVPGIYTADVLWCNQHIQGSPYEIFVASSEDELGQWRNRNREDITRKEGLI